MESAQEWAARVRAEIEAEQAAKSPEERAADRAKFEAWLASLPVAPEPGGTTVIFFKRRRNPAKQA